MTFSFPFSIAQILVQQILFQNRTEKIIILIFCVFPRLKYIDYVTCHVTCVMLFITVWAASCSVENLFPNCLCSVTRHSFGTC